ncbi:MAG: hypothetical protein QOH13_2268 [Thermoleophilaceae bacterium]|jgi:hypothetical protein|nr:hypothetical protein [Thermoleophilaceae bacterium]
MRAAAIVFAAFAALLGGSTLVFVLMDGFALPAALLGAAAAASLLVAAGLFIAGAGIPDTDPDAFRALPDASYATAALTIGVCLVVAGFVFDLFLILIGAGLIVLAFAGLARERQARKQIGAA